MFIYRLAKRKLHTLITVALKMSRAYFTLFSLDQDISDKYPLKLLNCQH